MNLRKTAKTEKSITFLRSDQDKNRMMAEIEERRVSKPYMHHQTDMCLQKGILYLYKVSLIHSYSHAIMVSPCMCRPFPKSHCNVWNFGTCMNCKVWQSHTAVALESLELSLCMHSLIMILWSMTIVYGICTVNMQVSLFPKANMYLCMQVVDVAGHLMVGFYILHVPN